MPSYSVPSATMSWQTLPAVTADAWLQPQGGDVYVTTDATPNRARSILVKDGVAYPVPNGQAIKVLSASASAVSLVLADR